MLGIALCQQQVIPDLEGEQDSTLGCGAEQLVFVVGVQRHPVRWSAPEVMAPV